MDYILVGEMGSSVTGEVRFAMLHCWHLIMEEKKQIYFCDVQSYTSLCIARYVIYAEPFGLTLLI